MKKALPVLHVCTVIFSIPVFILIFLMILNRPAVLVPHVSLENQVYDIVDNKSNKGKSKILKNEISGHGIRFEYILEEGYEYPFAGIGIKLGNSDNDNDIFRDITSFKYLKIQLTTSLKRKYRISLKTNNLDPGSGETSDKYRTLVHYIETTGKDTEYTLALHDFYTPTWWLLKNNYKKYLTDAEALQETFAIDIMDIKNYPFLSKENRAAITVKKMYLTNYRDTWGILTLIFIVAEIILIALRLVFRYIPGGPDADRETLGPYKKINLTNYEERYYDIITGYINSHYNEPDISIKDLEKTSGINVKKINSLLKKRYELTFKQVVNQIRIAESKRLLVETDCDITEVAFNLGFNSLPYFYQVFKNHVHMSPRDYRKKNKT